MGGAKMNAFVALISRLGRYASVVHFVLNLCRLEWQVCRAYLRWGRARRSIFTIKTAIVSAYWPGATADEVQSQVSERIEDKLRTDAAS